MAVLTEAVAITLILQPGYFTFLVPSPDPKDHTPPLVRPVPHRTKASPRLHIEVSVWVGTTWESIVPLLSSGFV